MGYFPILNNLGWPFSWNYGDRKKKIIFSNAQHNFAKGKVISKCRNDKPWKN